MKPFNPETHSLADFIRQQGGISTKKEFLKGECRDYFSITEGYNLLNNKTGKSLDYLLEACIEVGFLFFDATVTDLLNDLRQDVYSKKVFKKSCKWSFQKQDWKTDDPDFDAMFEALEVEDEILELTEEIMEDGYLMTEEIFNLYYGGLNHA